MPHTNKRMQKKEYFTDTFASIENDESSEEEIQDDDVFEFLDAEGNPFKSEEPLNYKIIGEDGTIIKEGTLSDNNTIPLKDIGTRKFSVVVDFCAVYNPEGFDYIDPGKVSENKGEKVESNSIEDKGEIEGESLAHEDEESEA